MKIVRADKTCVARLAAGNVKRIPTNPQYLAGYYVGCPAGCGLVVALPTHEKTFKEHDDGTMTMTEHRCDRCRRQYRIVRDEVVFDGA